MKDMSDAGVDRLLADVKAARSTAEIVADLRRMHKLTACIEAADRLVALEGEVQHLQIALDETLTELFTPPSTAVVRGDIIYVNDRAALMADLTSVYRYLREQKQGLHALAVIQARDTIELYDIVLDTLPVCPTCGGTKAVNDLVCDNCGASASLPFGMTCSNHLAKPSPCPDCSDGRVSVERLARLWTAVHAQPDFEVLQSHDAVSLLDHLRGVR